MTIAAKQCHAYLVDAHPGVRIGRRNCRLTSRGGISQHSAYGSADAGHANAIDVMGGSGLTTSQNYALIERIVGDLTEHRTDWSIRSILWQVRDHYTHAHIDFWPKIVWPSKWCGGPQVPSWRLPNGTIIKTRDPEPMNGRYEGTDMWIRDITDSTWKAWYDAGHITGNPAVMPDYYYASTTSTPDSGRIHAFNIAMQSIATLTKKGTS